MEKVAPAGPTKQAEGAPEDASAEEEMTKLEQVPPPGPMEQAEGAPEGARRRQRL